MYKIGDIVDVEIEDFFGTVEITDKSKDGTYEAIFFPEETILKVSEDDIVGYACEEATT